MTVAADTRSPRGPADRPQSRGGLRTAASRSTSLVAVLAVAASLAGLLIGYIYTGAASTAEMFRAYDLVTAAVAVPALALASRMVHAGSTRALLVTAGLLAYLVYTAAYYLFGTGFNDLFLLHVAVFTAAGFALFLTLAALDLESVGALLAAGARVRVVAGILGTLAVALGGMWVYFTGALDLTLLVPLYAAAALLLWRHAAWGYVLAAAALIAGVLHQLSYMLAIPFQVAADIPGATSFDPAEPAIVLLYLVATASLLHGSRRPS